MVEAVQHKSMSGMVSCYPEHIRKQVVEILMTGEVHKEWLSNDDSLCYLSVCSMSPPLKDACEEKLLDSLSSVNCIEALEIAQTFDLKRLKKETVLLIGTNFGELWNSDSFQHMSEKNLEIICNTVKIAKHPDIYRALEMWLGHDHEIRLKAYCKMLEIVQLQRTPQRQTCSRRNFTTYHAMLMSCTSKHSVFTAVFNCAGELVCHRKLFKSTDIKDGFSAACVQKEETDAPYVFISSGKHVFKYDPMLNKEETCASLSQPRTQSSLVSLGDSVYVIGGQHKCKSVTEIEELNTKQNSKFLKKQSWKVVAKIPDNIKLCSAPCVAYNNRIYIIGELSVQDQVSTVVLVFSPEDKSVKTVAEFPKQCSDCKAVLHGSDIYIASSEGYFLKFDIKSHIFSSCSDLPIKSRHFGMYIEGDMIFTVGGTSNENGTSRFEKDEYDIETNCWRRSKNLPCDLPIYGNVDIKVPSYTSVVPFYDTKFKELRH